MGAALNGGRQVAATFNGPRFPMRAITGAPYSGEEVGEHIQTLADGTHITQKFAERFVSRDSQGRVRNERPMALQVDSGVRIVEISDPVEGYQYTLDPVNKVAHRAKLVSAPARGGVVFGAVGSGGGSGSASGGRTTSLPAGELRTQVEAAPLPSPTQPPVVRPTSSSENLGTDTIEGLTATGHRTTMTWPAGSQGNDKPIVSTMESWTSQDLKIMLLSKNSDPRHGDSITRLINISRSEPDPALFRVPPDYQIVDEEGSFTIQFTIPAK